MKVAINNLDYVAKLKEYEIIGYIYYSDIYDRAEIICF